MASVGGTCHSLSRACCLSTSAGAVSYYANARQMTKTTPQRGEIWLVRLRAENRPHVPRGSVQMPRDAGLIDRKGSYSVTT